MYGSVDAKRIVKKNVKRSLSEAAGEARRL